MAQLAIRDAVVAFEQTGHGDVDLVLPYPDGLDEHDPEAHGVEHSGGVEGRARKPAGIAA